MVIGYSSAYLTHLERLKRDERERAAGIPPFMALLLTAVALHLGVLLPWMIFKSHAPVAETRQVHLTFGKKTGEYGGGPAPSSPPAAHQGTSMNDAVTSMDRMFSPPPPVKTAPLPPSPGQATPKPSPVAEPDVTPPARPESSYSQPGREAARHMSRPELRNSGGSSGNTGAHQGDGSGGGSGTGGEGGTDSAAREVISKYEQLLSGWIDRHKIYPAAALKDGMEGKVVLRLRIRRNGEVIRAAIERSSGYVLLDQAVLETVTRSAAMPAVPSEYPGGAQLEFLIPIRFSVK